MITIKEYNLNIKGTICLISDIHYKNRKCIKKLNKVLDNIKNINPSYICVTGDTLNSFKVDDEDIILDYFKRLSNISKVIVILGNHEYYKNKRKSEFDINNEFFEKLKDIENLYLLKNENICFDDINFYGAYLPIEHYMINKESMNSFKDNFKVKTLKGKYNVLLIHSPINLNEDNTKGFNLVLSGHMHGGVVPKFLRRIIKTGGIITPTKKMFPKFVYGYKKLGNTNLIITSGINMLSNNLFRKILNTEIVVIK